MTGCQADSPSVRRWVIKDSTTFEEFGEAIHHDHWVTALTSLSPGAHPLFPNVRRLFQSISSIFRRDALLQDAWISKLKLLIAQGIL